MVLTDAIGVASSWSGIMSLLAIVETRLPLATPMPSKYNVDIHEVSLCVCFAHRALFLGLKRNFALFWEICVNWKICANLPSLVKGCFLFDLLCNANVIRHRQLPCGHRAPSVRR
ncbi:MAG: hypothetical protein [Cressdnaviricota sp.]|nr:MAG: hypothetical protein [Cressdnaviricota sp.]